MELQIIAQLQQQGLKDGIRQRISQTAKQLGMWRCNIMCNMPRCHAATLSRCHAVTHIGEAADMVGRSNGRHPIALLNLYIVFLLLSIVRRRGRRAAGRPPYTPFLLINYIYTRPLHPQRKIENQGTTPATPPSIVHRIKKSNISPKKKEI